MDEERTNGAVPLQPMQRTMSSETDRTVTFDLQPSAEDWPTSNKEEELQDYDSPLPSQPDWPLNTPVASNIRRRISTANIDQEAKRRSVRLEKSEATLRPEDDNETDDVGSLHHHTRNQSSLPQFFFERQRDSFFHTPSEETLTRDVEQAEDPGEPPQKEKAEKDMNLINWEGPDDPENPQNWKASKKWWMTIGMSMMTFCITFASSIFSTDTIVTARDFHLSIEVTTLGTTLFVLVSSYPTQIQKLHGFELIFLFIQGFAFGPLCWGPTSELLGRTIPLYLGFVCFMIFQVPVAVASNIETILLCRFLGGMFGCAPLAVVGGALSDMWDPVGRGVAICFFAAALLLGPVIGPIVGGFVTESYLSWRWTAWITLIVAAVFLVFGACTIHESYAPVLLSRKARKIRFATKNWAIHAKADENQVDFHDLITKYFLRPFAMLAFEPILTMLTTYIALTYGTLYCFFVAYPLSFQEQRHWSAGIGALPFLGMTGGVILGGGSLIYVTKTRFAASIKKNGKIVPEERLPPMIVGSILLPVGLFWWAWTSPPDVSWVAQVLAGIPIGAGILMIFMQYVIPPLPPSNASELTGSPNRGLNYIIDVYLMYANSAIAANTLMRSLAGSTFPLFARPMYTALGIPWGMSLLGFLAAAMIPVPICFYIYGKQIRQRSRFAPTGAKMQAILKQQKMQGGGGGGHH
ncbi:hypothetical protein MMC12_000013 [Toensbergia leucococca]|nr:hypothetical protein [Toensbergia leucococca]